MYKRQTPYIAGLWEWQNEGYINCKRLNGCYWPIVSVSHMNTMLIEMYIWVVPKALVIRAKRKISHVFFYVASIFKPPLLSFCVCVCVCERARVCVRARSCALCICVFGRKRMSWRERVSKGGARRWIGAKCKDVHVWKCHSANQYFVYQKLLIEKNQCKILANVHISGCHSFSSSCVRNICMVWKIVRNVQF